jgi:mono/diheme cytochrome c family protein
MLTKILKWIGIVILGLIVLLVLTVGGLYAMGNARLTRHYAIHPEAITIASDEASLQHGQHLAETLCAHCHAGDFSGKELINDTMVGYIPSPNLTAGGGGAGGEFTDGDWVRAIRHGVDPEGRALIGMPSQNYYYMSNIDLGDLIAYLKSLQPVNHDWGEPNMAFRGKLLLAAGLFGKDILPAESINHNGTRPAAVDPGVNAEYGKYLAILGGCHDCHGQDYTGGKSPAPDAPHAPDLTKNGSVGAWSKETFISAVRTSQSDNMPWEELRPLNDSDLEAIYTFLQSLPVKSKE